MPFSKVWVSAMKIGYSRQELAVMPYGEIIYDLAAMNDDWSVEQEQTSDGAVTKATQNDIRTMLG